MREALDEFENIFGRRPHGAFTAEQTEDAEVVLVACNTMARRCGASSRRGAPRGRRSGW